MQAFVLLRSIFSLIEKHPSVAVLDHVSKLWPLVLKIATQYVHNEEEVCSYTDAIDALRRLRVQESTSLRNFEKEPIDQDILLNSGMFARITDIYVPPEICLVDLF